MTDRLRWNIRYDRDGPSIEPSVNGCRQYDCCGGWKCGLDTRGAMAEIRGYYRDRLKFFEEMTPAVFLRYFGYEPDDQLDLFEDTEADVCTCASCRRNPYKETPQNG